MRYFTIIISTILSLLILEIFVRFYVDNGMNYEIEMMKYANKLKIISSNKEIGIEHRKNVKGVFMGANVSLNSDGFRNKKDINKNSKKILMLGDSMTFGWGAENPFPNLLNTKIKNYEVINAGIGNTNTLMQIENFFENYSKKYKYNMIVLNFFINDFENVLIKKPNLFEKNSYLYTFLNNKFNNILIKFKIKKNWQVFYSQNYQNSQIKKDTFEKILMLKNYCNKNNIIFIIHMIPELRNMKNYKFLKENSLLENFSLQNNIMFLNSLDVLKDFKESDLWVTKLDPHANDKAHQIIAEYIYSKIENLVN